MKIELAIHPRSFTRQSCSGTTDPYLSDPAIGKLAEFFRDRGVATLKDLERRDVWYQDWLDFQAKNQLYAAVISPRQYSSLGHQLDLLRLTRFLEVFAYFSPAHGYSLQVSFLGLFAILTGTNDRLKQEAVTTLEAGGLLALGVSEQNHGSDLLSNEFNIKKSAPDAADFLANGRKYYIGNANCAAIISILARNYGTNDPHSKPERRTPFVFIVIRPEKSPHYRVTKRIHTLGVRSAFVGEFEVADHPIPASDIIAEGRGAWDAVFGAVTLGKFFLGFGSIGMCEHAMEEAFMHLRGRILYRKSALDMPHVRLAMAQAYARLAAMKLYAYRALDYVQSAGATDRRYLLFCAVQKAKVSTDGTKVMAQLSECVGARGFECETYFESALRDIQLIPGLEGSKHINLGMTAQFAKQYFARPPASAPQSPQRPPSLARGEIPAVENPYLMQARTSAITDVTFAHFLDAYRPLKEIANVRRFARQARGFARLVRRRERSSEPESTDTRITLCLGQCLATIAYAQLIAENAKIFATPAPMISAMFHLLVSDLSDAARDLAALPGIDPPTRGLAGRLISIPRTSASDWDFAAQQLATLEGG